MTTKRSKIRDSARGQQCMVIIPGTCNSDPATTVLAHTGSGTDKRNRETEAWNSAYACSDCHDAIDFRTRRFLSDDPETQADLHHDREMYIARAERRTQRILADLGLMPK